MKGLLFYSLFLIFLISSANANSVKPEIELKVIRGVLSQQSSNEYFHSLLKEALSYNKSNIEYKLIPVDFEFSQNRTLRLLNYDNVLDVTHSMTSVERELKYIAIKIPLLNGLYGKRKFLVMEKDKQLFDNITLDNLKQKVACQGRHWPDFEKLQSNGFSVYGVNNYEANYKLLAKGRCSYFPRGIAEIDSDFNKYNGKYGKLAIIDSIVLMYDAPIYFFVGKHQPELAKTIETGLRKMQASGRILQALAASKAFQFDSGAESSDKTKVFLLDESK